MAELDDIDGLAGEYLLGTLDPAERAAVAARRRREPDLDAAIAAWEARFAPLLEAIAPVAPPDHLIEAIMRRIDGGGREGIVGLHRRLRGWRIAAFGAAALAATLAALIVADGLRAWRPAPNFVAVLQKDAASPAFIVSVDIAARSLDQAGRGTADNRQVL
ncbi:MAG: hypothetical protein K0R27_1288 [Xanthobacteraceae bacterium]|jgi:anti-sigma-K factor RskA|nr:hypothetical protein [Xanthobacteraceae bacterium]